MSEPYYKDGDVRLYHGDALTVLPDLHNLMMAQRIGGVA